MSESLTLTDALARYRNLAVYQARHYRDLNWIVRFESRFMFLWPLLAYAIYVILAIIFPAALVKVFAIILGTGLVGTSIYRWLSATKARTKFEEQHGLLTHQAAIRKFNLQNL